MPDRVVHTVRKKSRGRHPWVFSNEVRRVEGDPGVGEAVLVFDRRRLLGSGIYSPHSLIRVRLYSTEDEELTEELVCERARAALARRRALLPEEDDFRLLYGESDCVPGLVVDKYGDQLAVQTYAAGFDIRLPLVVAALRAALDPACIVEKNDFRLRELEGLPRREGVLFGAPDPGLRIRESGVSFGVDIAAGQKTGYYFDHRLTRRRARALAAGRSVLDVFSYTGSFAVNAALGGAREVLAVDASQSACRLAERNAALNDVAGRCTFAVGNAFEYLAELGRQGRRFGLICLDPPAFIKSRREHAAGLRGYRQLNGLAMRLLDSGGILISSSCSHHLFWPELLGVLMQAAEDAGRSFVILDRLTQGPDHPVLLSMPESEYLRCLVLQVV